MNVGDVDELSRIEQELRPWVRDHVAYPDVSLHGRCYKVTLRHLNVNRENQGDVCSHQVKLDPGAEDDGVIPLLHTVATAAQRDADDLNAGVQLYALYAYYEKDRNFAVRKMFRVAPSTEAEFDRQLSPSEPASDKGMAAQAMRHTEVMMRQMAVMSGMALETQRRELARLSEMNERYSQQQIDFLILFQDTMNMATDRRLKERREEANIALKEEGLAKLAALAPVVINRLAGKAILPEEDQSLMLMSSLLENMSDEQQQQFLSMLNDTQKMTLAEIMHQYEAKKSRWIEGRKNMVIGARNELPGSRPSPPKPAARGPSTEPSREDVCSVSGAKDVIEAVPMPTEIPLRERLTAATDKPQDPILQKIEASGESFASRFKDFLSPKK
jgi:hypothetical protein